MEIGVSIVLEKEELHVGNDVICQRSIRVSSRENPFNVTGECDVCGDVSERMSLATYTFPKDTDCLCCNGRPHTIIIKFCKRCSPPTMQAIVENRLYHETKAADDLIRMHSKDYKRITARHLARNCKLSGSSYETGMMTHSKSSGVYLDGLNEVNN